MIIVGEDYDRVTWLHELSHHWFDDDEFDETWLREGMAEMAPAVLGDELGIDVAGPEPPAEDLDLESWDTQVDESRSLQHEDPEAWHELTERLYGGAHHVKDTIRAEIGDQAWRRVVAAHITEQSAWDGPGDEQVSIGTGWRELVDLVETGTVPGPRHGKRSPCWTMPGTRDCVDLASSPGWWWSCWQQPGSSGGVARGPPGPREAVPATVTGIRRTARPTDLDGHPRARQQPRPARGRRAGHRRARCRHTAGSCRRSRR